ncbi:MAG: hypothetical protein AMXMBFR47_09270 [Planctomycetota bacterium]
MGLPTREEINVYDSLDERVAVEHFLGRTLDEAEYLFCENPLRYFEDLMWMGPIAFRFYVIAAIRYLTRSPRRVLSGDYFASVIGFRLDYEPEELKPVGKELLAAFAYLSEQAVSSPLAVSEREALADTYRRLSILMKSEG